MINDTMSKTFANNAETILLMLGMVMLLSHERGALYDHLIPACLMVSFVVRGTSVVGWFVLVLFHLSRRADIILIYVYVWYQPEAENTPVASRACSCSWCRTTSFMGSGTCCR